MNRTHLLVALAVALAAVPGDPARAATEARGGQPGAWLMDYSGARTLGMGGAFVAVANDALGVLWNPAGLQRMDQNQLMFENSRLFEESSINAVSFGVPGNWLPSFGVSMIALRSGEFERTNEMNDPLGAFRETETAWLFTVAKAFSPRLAVGANVKGIQQSVEDYSASGFGFDVGAMIEAVPGLHLGASVANLGGPSLTLRNTPEEFPVTMRGGAAWSVFGGRGLVAAEYDHLGDAGGRLHAGAEYWIQSGLALRAGIEEERPTGGFSYRFAPQYQLDYAAADHPLGLTHRVGIAYRFGGFFASSRAEPQVFSPTGEQPTTQIRLAARTKGMADQWTLDVVDKNHEVVRRFGGPGLPPAHIQWDGKDENGLPVADGTYAYRLVVKDKDGRALDSPVRRVVISTSGPQGEVPVVTSDE